MATPSLSTTAGAAGFVTKGAPGVAGHFTDNRKFSLSDLLVWQERRWAKLDTALRREGATVVVDDPAPKVITNTEAPIKFDIAADGSDEVYEGDVVDILNTQAAFLQAADVLEVNGIFCDADGDNYATTKFGSSYTPETVIVQSVSPGLGSTTSHAKVLVIRGNGNATDAPAAGVVQTIVSEYKLVHIGNALADDGNAPTPIHHEPGHIQNYCQFFSRTWSMTTQEKPLNTYGKMSMEDRAALKRKEFFRLKELAHFRGRKSKPTINNKDQFLTGGMVEFVPGSSDSLDGENRLIDFAGPFDLDNYMVQSEIIGRYGSDVKHAFVGGKYLSAMWNHFQKSITYNDELSARYGWAVWELDTGHVRLMMHRHPMFTDVSTTLIDYHFDAAIVDLEYIKLMIYIDVQTRDEIQAPNTHRQENEIFCQVGLWRTFPDAHAYIYGITG